MKWSVIIRFWWLLTSKIEELIKKSNPQSSTCFVWRILCFLWFQLKTMITKDPKFQNVIGWAKGFSETDKVQINKMYQCVSTPIVFSDRIFLELGLPHEVLWQLCGFSARKYDSTHMRQWRKTRQLNSRRYLPAQS